MLKLKKITSEKYPDFPEKGMRFLPNLHLDSKQIPEIAEWEVGKEYEVILRIKQVSKSENDTEKDGKVNSINASFDIVAYKPIEDYDDEDLEEMQGRAMST